jgi:hypothetical protein
MSDTFSIRVTQWLDKSLAVEKENLAGKICITIGGRCATRVADNHSLRDSIGLSARYLAEWFIFSWDTLCNDEEPPNLSDRYDEACLDWRLDHDMNSIGYGYHWPALRFACEGEFMTVYSFGHEFPITSLDDVRVHRVGYIENIPKTAIPLREFASEVADFADVVIQKAAALEVDVSELEQALGELRERGELPEPRVKGNASTR